MSVRGRSRSPVNPPDKICLLPERSSRAACGPVFGRRRPASGRPPAGSASWISRHSIARRPPLPATHRTENPRSRWRSGRTRLVVFGTSLIEFLRYDTYPRNGRLGPRSLGFCSLLWMACGRCSVRPLDHRAGCFLFPTSNGPLKGKKSWRLLPRAQAWALSHFSNGQSTRLVSPRPDREALGRAFRLPRAWALVPSMRFRIPRPSFRPS